MNHPLISIIVPALNEERMIGKCLAALAAQNADPDRFEIIVVDNGSVDSTVATVREFHSQLNLSILSNRGHVSAVRNFGAAAARGEFLAFLDADCCAPPGWLTRAIPLLQSGDGGVMGGYHAIPTPSSWIARAWWGDLSKTKKGQVSYIPSGTLLVSRRVFVELGGFDENLQTSEDFELCDRVASAGYQVLAYPELSTVHLGTPQTLRAFYRQHKWHGSGVRTAFFKNVFHPRFAKTVMLTVYTMFWALVTLLTVPVAILTSHLSLLAVGLSFLLLGAAIMSIRDAAIRKRPALIVPLIPLYIIYGLARSLSLLSLYHGTSPRSSSNSLAAPIANSDKHRSADAPFS